MSEVNNESYEQYENIDTPVDNDAAEVTRQPGISDEHRELFGLKVDKQEPEAEEEAEVQEEEEQEEVPTTEQALAKLRIKYNGEEQELDEEKAREYAQKGMNYDKVAEKLRQQEAALDRIAKNQGFKDHADLVANLDKLEEQQHQQKKEAFKQYEQDLLYQAEQAGLDPEEMKNYLDNHPAIVAGREMLQQREQERVQREEQQKEERLAQGWVELLQTYPDLASEIKEGVRPEWLTDDMDKMISDGYKPIHAYRLVHGEKLTQQQRKAAEQQVLKQQRLNKRSGSIRDASGQFEKQASTELKGAFAMLGLDPERANKYAK